MTNDNQKKFSTLLINNSESFFIFFTYKIGLMKVRYSFHSIIIFNWIFFKGSQLDGMPVNFKPKNIRCYPLLFIDLTDVFD